MNLSNMRNDLVSNGITPVAMNSTVVPEQTVVIPESIQYPDYRRAYDSGTLAPGDTVVLTTQIFDVDGNEKSPDNNVVELSLSQYTQDPTKEVLGVLYFNFVESNIPLSNTADPEIGASTKLDAGQIKA